MSTHEYEITSWHPYYETDAPESNNGRLEQEPRTAVLLPEEPRADLRDVTTNS
jgi:hypothetical protein